MGITGWVNQSLGPNTRLVKSFIYFHEGRAAARVDLIDDGRWGRWQLTYTTPNYSGLKYEDLPEGITEDEAQAVALTIWRMA